jgi:hypothetical protein
VIPELLDSLTNQWKDSLLAAGLVLKQPLSALQAGGARGKDRKVNFLIFNGSQSYPLLVLKVARSHNYQTRLRQEYQALTEISAFSSLRGTVPGPIGLFEIDNHLVVAEKFMPGTPLSILLRKREHVKEEQVRDDLQIAQNWLALFQKATWSGNSSFSSEVEVQATGDLWKQLPPGFSNDLAACAESFYGLQFPLVGSHGDFWPGNLLLAESGPGVIDWEHYKRRFPPFRDAFVFITTYARTYPWKGWSWPSKAEAFHKAFLEKNWFSELLLGYFSKCLANLSLPLECAHYLFSLFLLDMAAEEKAEGKEDGQWVTFLQTYATRHESSILRRL